MTAPVQDDELEADILKAVSRSFYLTLRLLPKGVREPISLGYLLARLSDTIADAGSVEVEVRKELLDRYRVLLSAPAKRVDAQKFAQSLPGRLENAGLARGEWDLILRAGDCFDWLDRLDRRVSRHIRKVVGVITEGQAWDLERFEGEEVVRLDMGEELERYAYQVAGCVGEFWTEIGFECQDGFCGEAKSVMLEWGANYGRGLQLVNILRDLPEDLERGRCYLPGQGMDQNELLGAAAEWRARARIWLADGFRYAAALRGIKLRMATGLPALLGIKTLDRLDRASWSELAEGVKVTRRQVKWSLCSGLWRSLPVVPPGWKSLAKS